MNLKRIADNMMRDAIAKRKIMLKHRINGPGIDQKHLRGGVTLRLSADDTEFNLLVIRGGDVLPSDVEMKVFRNVFEVPEGARVHVGGQKHLGTRFYWLIWPIPEKFKMEQAPLEIKNEPAH